MGEPADREPELQRPPGAIAFPERHFAGLSGRRRHEHAIVSDLFDPPRRRAQHEGLADAALEHHLFVELADACGAFGRPEQEDAEEPTVGNGAAVGDGDPLGSLARGQRAADAIPGDARPQLGELVGGIAPGQHVEHAFERTPRQLGERRGPADGGEQIVDAPVVHGGRRHDLLRDDIQWISRIARRFHRAVVHGLRNCGARHQVPAELGEITPSLTTPI